MVRLGFYIAFLIFMLLLVGCEGEKTPKHLVEDNPKKYDKQLMKVNQYMTRLEAQEIDDYIKRYGWKMIETASGLHYEIYFSANSRKVANGDTIRLKYKLNLINGVQIYNSDKIGPKEFIVGMGQAERGLDESVKLMKYGDKAHIIIPSHLGFGLLGDQKQIPAKATLIYDIEIIDPKHKP